MENKKFEVGQFWKDSDGNKHLICNVDGEKVITYSYSDESINKFFRDYESLYGLGNNILVEPWQEPRSGEVWVNIYEKDDGTIYAGYAHFTKQQIDETVINYIARIKMPWKEGQFDE